MSEKDSPSLVDFGLTSLQSRVYIALLRIGTCKPSRISSLIGIVRPESYRVLRELGTKGLVRRNPGLPSTYTAIPPNQAVPLMLDRFRQRLAALEQKQSAVINNLRASTPIEDKLDQRFSLVTGGGNLVLKIRRMIMEAKYDYVGIMSKYGLGRAKDSGVASAIRTTTERNVPIRLITEIDDSNMDNANLLSRYIELRRSRDVMLHINIVDKKEMVFGPALTDEEASERIRREALWTNNPMFIRGMYTLFEKLWKASPKYFPKYSGG